MANNFVSKFGEMDVENMTVKDFMEDENLKNYYDSIYHQALHGYVDLSRERVLKDVNTEDFYRELFNACAEGDLYEEVIHSQNIGEATKEFIDFVENNEYLSTESRRMLIDGFKSSVEAEYIHAFEEEKAMFDCVKDFPENGSIELATEKLLDGIEKKRFSEKELDFLKTQLKDFSHIKEGLENNPDFLLDMQHSGQLVPMPKTYYTNDLNEDIKEYAELILKDLMDGESAIHLGVARGDEDNPQQFFHALLGEELYKSDVAKSLRNAGDNFDMVTDEFFDMIADKRLSDKKEEILDKFREEIEGGFENDEHLWESILETKQEETAKHLLKDGFFKVKETYLILAPKHYSGYRLVDVENLNDIIKEITPEKENVLYKLNITHKENTSYFEANLSLLGENSLDNLPMGSHVFVLPESQWDRVEGYNKETGAYGQGYSFLEEAKKIDEVKEIFLSRRMLREMEKEAEKNPIIKEMKEIYEWKLDEYTTAENFQYHNSDEELLGKDFHYELFDSPSNKSTNNNMDAWKQVARELAYNVVKSSNVKENYKKAEALLIKFNPTLQTSYEVVKYFKQQCENMMKYYKSAGKNNQNHR